MSDILPVFEKAMAIGIGELEKEMLEMKQELAPVIHRFGPGVYIREVHLPKGIFAVGHHQNFDHMNVFLKGRVTILNDDGTTSDLVAPMIFVGKPGRKVGYIHEDVVWLNVYATEERDIETLENTFITKSDNWKNSENEKRINEFKSAIDREDFFKCIEELGYDELTVRDQSCFTGDLIDLPDGNYKIKKGKSAIEGTGIFATSSIEDGEIIAPARIDGGRTITGRYTNHSAEPNAKMIRFGDDIYLVATRNITGCSGGFDGEEITIDYRQAYKVNKEIMEDLCHR